MPSARKRPSASSAKAASITESRAWLSLTNASERVDIQWTARPVSRAATIRAGYSG